jgi:hypothetical protein
MAAKTDSSSSNIVRRALAHLPRAITLPLGVLIASRQAMRARPAFGTVAAVVAWVGFTSLFASVAIGDYLAQAGIVFVAGHKALRRPLSPGRLTHYRMIHRAYITLGKETTTMRMLLKWEIGLEAGNDAVRSGKIAELNQRLMALIHPEAVYFGTEGGTRTAYIFFNLDDPAMMPVIAEPLFQELQSKVEFLPVMNADDLQRGLAKIAQQ